MPIYQHFASGIDGKCFSPQEAVATLVGGIEACAQWSEEPPRYQKGDSPEHIAWQAIGEILFWVRRGSAVNGSLDRIEKLWAQVSGPVVLAAGDVLYQLSHSQWRFRDGSRPHVDLITMFAKEVQPIVEYCIRHRESLPSVFSYGGSADRNVIRFLINVLGRIGDVTAISTLQATADDREFGRDAVAAIESIQKATMARRQQSYKNRR